jgi:DNA polymerase I-like protein with 3'-5' exonuclease and polymerase domains
MNQGGAADVVMKAMLVLHAHERFRQLGWRIVLQVHDEIIAEGPEESTGEAMAIVKQCMQRPFKQVPMFFQISCFHSNFLSHVHPSILEN